MEDQHIVEQEKDGAILAAVFDGHGGPWVSQLLHAQLYPTLLRVARRNSLSEIATKQDCIQIMEQSLALLDDDVLGRGGKWNRQGSTALVAWLHRSHTDQSQQQQDYQMDNVNHNSTGGEVPRSSTKEDTQTLIVANIGDSRAVMGRILLQKRNDEENPDSSSWLIEAITLTRDHKPDDPDEKHRIEEVLGGKITYSLVDVPRVNGVLALSRAIGDGHDRPFVSSQPEFTAIEINKPLEQEDDSPEQHQDTLVVEFVILATDGLWEVMSSEKAVHFVASLELKGTPRPEISKEIVKAALLLGSYDNITVVIVWFGSKRKNN